MNGCENISRDLIPAPEREVAELRALLPAVGGSEGLHPLLPGLSDVLRAAVDAGESRRLASGALRVLMYYVRKALGALTELPYALGNRQEHLREVIEDAVPRAASALKSGRL